MLATVTLPKLAVADVIKREAALSRCSNPSRVRHRYRSRPKGICRERERKEGNWQLSKRTRRDVSAHVTIPSANFSSEGPYVCFRPQPPGTKRSRDPWMPNPNLAHKLRPERHVSMKKKKKKTWSNRPMKERRCGTGRLECMQLLQEVKE
ncbi:hypothetical protein MPH_06041 [Macrophomina phaseolina MS6]|uniref:Uncharacterized protein n=1 Tax=Macrophomina phaseolina (strain MS6) TaxID=1126212 RepID=K2R364_MACPH|nr:hypothetical protein MPH_06041 [Macrophomina phaseolina MS6]